MKTIIGLAAVANAAVTAVEVPVATLPLDFPLPDTTSAAPTWHKAHERLASASSRTQMLMLLLAAAARCLYAVAAAAVRRATAAGGKRK